MQADLPGIQRKARDELKHREDQEEQQQRAKVAMIAGRRRAADSRIHGALPFGFSYRRNRISAINAKVAE